MAFRYPTLIEAHDSEPCHSKKLSLEYGILSAFNILPKGMALCKIKSHNAYQKFHVCMALSNEIVHYMIKMQMIISLIRCLKLDPVLQYFKLQ